MTEPATAVPLAPPRALRQLWHWIRTTILRAPPRRTRPRRSLPSVLAGPLSHAPDADPTPLTPQNAKPRTPRVPSPSAVLAPIRHGLSEVPPLPHVIRELLHELADPASSARSVARIAASDPALAAGLIRTVNSAAAGVRRDITSVADAVSLLGYSTVRSLVIRMRLQRIMPTRPGDAQQAYDAEDLWVHSLAVAGAAEALADRLPTATPADRGFVATLGLLHDIGKLAINSYFPASAAQIKTRDPDFPDESFLDRERRVLGADHAEIGAMLAAHWRLPADLVEAIRWHHAPDAAPAFLSDAVRTATITVHAANQLAKYCYVHSEDVEIDIVPDDLLRRIGLPAPLPRLLASPVRRAISRAIFFADDIDAARTLGAIRRFLRVSEHPPLPALRPPPNPARHEPHVAWADDNWIDDLVGPDALTIDCSPSSSARADHQLRLAGRRARLTSRCTAGGVDRLLTTALAHLDQLPLDDAAKLPARFVLRRLLPNLSEIAAAEPVEVLQSCNANLLVTAVRCPALAFAHRFAPGTHRRAARHVVNAELANVLNLRWFARILTPRDGSALIFLTPLPPRS
jgi:putative nucleotidyltransferase with HDIG domain